MLDSVGERAFTGNTNNDCTSETPGAPIPDVPKVSKISNKNFSEGPDPGNRQVCARVTAPPQGSCHRACSTHACECVALTAQEPRARRYGVAETDSVAS